MYVIYFSITLKVSFQVGELLVVGVLVIRIRGRLAVRNRK